MLVWLAENQQMDGARVRVILGAMASALEECPRSRKVVARQIGRLDATVSEEGVACEEGGASAEAGASPSEADDSESQAELAANDDAESGAIGTPRRVPPSLLPTVCLRSLAADEARAVPEEITPDPPPEAA
jgi:hypothetical protein